MCEPVSITAAIVAAVSAYADYQGAKTQEAGYKAEAEAAGVEASQKVKEGSSRAYQQVRAARAAAATQDAAIGANGLLSSGGSALNVLSDTYQEGQNAANQEIANGYSGALTSRWNQNIALASAKNTGDNALAGSLLTGASTYVGMGGSVGGKSAAKPKTRTGVY